MQIATLGSNHYSQPILEIVGDTCDVKFARQQIFVKSSAVVVQLTELSYVQHHRLISSATHICMAEVYA